MEILQKCFSSLWLHWQCLWFCEGVSSPCWFIVSKVLHCVTSHYFDDFPTLERAEGCKVLTLAFSAVLDLLGWEHAKEGDKAISFASTFDLLGVTFDLNGLPKRNLHDFQQSFAH